MLTEPDHNKRWPGLKGGLEDLKDGLEDGLEDASII